MEQQPQNPPGLYRISDINNPGQNVEKPTRYYGEHAHVRNDSRSIWELRKNLQTLLNFPKSGFPGAQPVSFLRRHIEELRREDYYVCEKSDGVRYLLWLTEDDHGGECQYLINRKNEYFHINETRLHFPLPPPEEDKAKFHKDTIVDGELVLDDVGGGRKEPVFLVFDCLVIDGMSLVERTLDKRLGYFKERVFKPYKELFREYPDEQQFQAFRVELKDMQVSYGLEMMFRQVLPKLRHGNDGLIFTCRNSSYVFGTDDHIVKWKPPEENTIDFKLALTFPRVEPDPEIDGPDAEPYEDYDSIPVAQLLAWTGKGNPETHFGDLYLTPEEWEALKKLNEPLHGRVVECGQDEQKRWRLHRFRDDKENGNFIKVMGNVMESIRDGVSEKELIDASKGIRDSWKQRAR
ncbi:uncharacterized protein PpBr36_06054 [Pyricularia pennisetigena]|uniref:uncharacterized protein n=1 Tax=Pyricularia pennisetigena TaxID=1578925 RepID=UPI0011512418|nr:uncharacterized protein PpBr36_06054 [Pyricularia pennisetigena]TLS22766.1 hypothetical protein PpBr36_06054 [Pyricularia pennisetigena]